jgi:hypothetical protein
VRLIAEIERYGRLTHNAESFGDLTPALAVLPER